MRIMHELGYSWEFIRACTPKDRKISAADLSELRSRRRECSSGVKKLEKKLLKRKEKKCLYLRKTESHVNM